MVWTPTEERWWVYWEKDAEDGLARKKETGKAKKEVYGCGERGHGWGWSDGGSYSWLQQLEKENQLWRPLMGKAERRRSLYLSACMLFNQHSTFIMAMLYTNKLIPVSVLLSDSTMFSLSNNNIWKNHEIVKYDSIYHCPKHPSKSEELDNIPQAMVTSGLNPETIDKYRQISNHTQESYFRNSGKLVYNLVFVNPDQIIFR